MNPLLTIKEYGQSIWLDYLSRPLVESGQLRRLIRADGLSGMTSNPAIFNKAITGGNAYDETIRTLAGDRQSVDQIYRTLVVTDIQDAADDFSSVYTSTGGRDGYVSLEVSPHLAHNTEGTVREARELWLAVNRPNIFIKVPGTEAGIPAIRQLISEGININVTLLFGLPRYQAVAQAYIDGLAERVQRGHAIENIRSVASFFLSRIDVLVDQQLEAMIEPNGPQAAVAADLRGQVAIASAKQAYQMYKQIFGSDQFLNLQAQGANEQRLLWASTSTKDPAYSDVKYVEALIGPNTVNTLPQETLEAYRDHGQPAPRLEEDLEASYKTLTRLYDVGIDLDDITAQLETEGVQKFIEPFDELLETISRQRQAVLEGSGPSPAPQPNRPDNELNRAITLDPNSQVDEEMWETFPASDPPGNW
ncbi:MAG: transaldolase [Anaerolineae bacterium]|nr:transaldolase [Anaerolineae bacterium]